MEANNALGYTAAAQEAGIPVTYTYLSDVHDDQYNQNHGNAFGPGEAGMEAQLREYNAAFAAFFHRLKADHITRRNTLFLITVDEGDHYAGGPPLNPGCDGVTTPCQYGSGASGSPRNVGEVDVNLPALVKGSTGDSTLFGFDNDDAPAVIVPNQSSPSGARPGPGSRRPWPGAPHLDHLGVRSDHRVLHADHRQHGRRDRGDDPPHGQPGPEPRADVHALRKPGLLLPGSLRRLVDRARTGVPQPEQRVRLEPRRHPAGDRQHLAGLGRPGGAQPGPDESHLDRSRRRPPDHDDRARLARRLHLDGRAIEQIIDRSDGGPDSVSGDRGELDELGAVYKQLDAPFGEFGLDTLDADTRALATSSTGDAAYTGMDRQLQACESARAGLLPAIQHALGDAEAGGRFDTARPGG